MLPISQILQGNTPQVLLRRAGILFASLPLAPGLVMPLDFRTPWSEFNPLNHASPLEFMSALRDLVYPIQIPLMGALLLPFKIPDQRPPIRDREGWFFVNGIGTDRNIIQLNSRALASLFRRKIHLIHNPTNGLLIDLLKAAFGVEVQLRPSFEADLAKQLVDALETFDRVVLISHSQGSIIATNALRLLVQQAHSNGLEELLERIEFYSFGSAANAFDIREVYAEHFFNRWDLIPRLGVFFNGDRFEGRRFEARTTGHLLNAHYLKNLLEGRFVSLDGQPSRLVEKLAPTPPAPQPTLLQWLTGIVFQTTLTMPGTPPARLQDHV
ncbi:MAG: hypothetical protein R3296_00025 [Oleiphilaceae bacterium]|nr:hypothetical protein [Oleiphilaceae bacterium]